MRIFRFTMPHCVITRCVAVLCLLLTAAAQVERADEDQVKAAYLYNFVKFVDWPANRFSGANDPTIICLVGDDRLAEVLRQTVLRKAVKGRPLEARELRDDGEIKGCHILLIAFQDRTRILKALRSAQACNVLTVGQTEEFTRLGGMINLVRKENSIELEINPKAAEAEGLKISSRLLAVSRIVTGGGTT